MEKIIKNKVILEILDKYRQIWTLGHLGGLANWDLSVYMPEDGAGARVEALAKLSTLMQKLFLDRDFVELIKKAENEKDLDDSEKAILRTLKEH